MDKEICSKYGINWDEGVARFRGKDDIFKRLLAMFLDDETFRNMQKAYEAGDNAALFNGAHELKGVSGNSSMDTLYDCDCLLVEYLRTGGDDREKITALFAAVKAAYEKAVEGVHLALEL